MTLAGPTASGSKPKGDPRLIAQALVVFALAIPATGVGWLAAQGDEVWFGPAMVLIVAARFAYDRFFSTADQA
jgi:hypothetical protein